MKIITAVLLALLVVILIILAAPNAFIIRAEEPETLQGAHIEPRMTDDVQAPEEELEIVPIADEVDYTKQIEYYEAEYLYHTSLIGTLQDKVVELEARPLDVQPLRAFDSEAQLKSWLKVNRVPNMGDQKCVAEALELQRRAYRDGYQVSAQAIFYGKWQPDREWEMVNSTFVGRTLYFFQPITGRLWEAGNSIKPLR